LSPQAPEFTRFSLLFYKVLNLYETASYEEALMTIEEESRCGAEDIFRKLCLKFLRGVVLVCIGDGKKGYEIVENISRKMGETILLGPYFSNNYLSAWYRRHGSPVKAVEAIKTELSFNRERGNQYSIASCLVNLGANKMRKAKARGAAGMAELEEAHEIAQRRSYQYILTQVHFHRAWKALQTGEMGTALREITQSLDLAARYRHDNFIVQEGRLSLELLAFAFEQDVHRNYLLKIYGFIGPEAMPVLAPLLKSDSALVRAATVKALAVTGDTGAAPLIRCARRDKDSIVRRAANAELARLRSSIGEPEKILTKRENQVLALMAEGLSNSEIAENCYISELTVKTHISHIFKKLGFTRRSQAAVYCQLQETKSGKSKFRKRSSGIKVK